MLPSNKWAPTHLNPMGSAVAKVGINKRLRTKQLTTPRLVTNAHAANIHKNTIIMSTALKNSSDAKTCVARLLTNMSMVHGLTEVIAKEFNDTRGINEKGVAS